MRAGAWILAALTIACAGRGAVVKPEGEAVTRNEGEEVALPERMRFGMCVGYLAKGGSAAFERGRALFDQADADYRAERDEVAARGYLAAAAVFREASVEDAVRGPARTNMRIAYADAALAWLMASRPDAARAALQQALAEDPELQADWQAAIDRLPKPPPCAFKLEATPAEPVKPPVAEPVAEPPEAPPAPVVHEPCGKSERGAARRKHEFIGETVAELDERGGEILCGRDPIWQLRFGTTCGDMASFHTVVTVEVRAGKVTRVWEREQYNAGFCGSQF